MVVEDHKQVEQMNREKTIEKINDSIILTKNPIFT
jgi:hypothetical protein